MKGAIYYVAIATVIFSHVKISSFRAKAQLVFINWCLYNKLWILTACELFLCFATFFSLGGILLTSCFFLIHLFYLTCEFYRFLHQDEPNLFHLSSSNLIGHGGPRIEDESKLDKKYNNTEKIKREEMG